MDPEIFQELATVFGNFATGFKKLKSICTRLANNEVKPQVTAERSLRVEPRELNIENALFDIEELKNSKRISLGSIDPLFQSVLKLLVRRRIRMDRFKNSWIYSGEYELENKKSWKKVSNRTIQNIYNKLSQTLDDLREWFKTTKIRPPHLIECRWKKRTLCYQEEIPSNFRECDVFMSYCRENHTHFPSLR